MKIAIEGCAHGELEQIYNSIQLLEEKENVKVDLLICCGDFQSTRNLQDLRCMAVPPKYQDICTFYKYFSGEKTAPILTIFIGGNHEASNYLQELSYGGWVAPNVYYMGYASVVNVAGVRIGGLSGIYKSNDYNKGRFEISPYQESSKRSVYHIRNIDIFRLKQLSQPIDIFISHDWPNEITKYGNIDQLLKKKPFFRQDIESNNLGSPPAQEVLNHLKPSYWFSAHLHCKFAALVPHYNNDNELEKTTKFLALDKCLPRRNFLQIVDIKHDDTKPIEIHYDLEWLTILHYTNHLVNVKNCIQYMPGPNGAERWNFTPTEEEKSLILEKFSNNLKVPENFIPTAIAYNPEVSEQDGQPEGQTNPQTIEFCNILGIDDPTNLFLHKMGKNETPKPFNFIPWAVEIKQSNNRLNISLPEPKVNNQKIIEKLNMTLPAPKNDFQDYENTIEDLSENSNKSESEKESSTIEKVRLSLPPPKNDDISNLEISNSEIFPNLELSTSTPQKKKFKRRNESIYNAEEG